MLTKQNCIIKYFVQYLYGSDLSVRRLNLFLACHHINSCTNLFECEDQSSFKVQAVPVPRFDWSKMFSLTTEDILSCHFRYPRVPLGVRLPQVEGHWPRLRTGRPRMYVREIFLFSIMSRRALGLTHFLIQLLTVLVLPERSGKGTKLTTHLRIIPSSRMEGVKPTLSHIHISTWHGV
jgi:hypothetical protein